jgi:hypothetical protein
VAAASYWPQSDKFGEAFAAGVAESQLPDAEKEAVIDRQRARGVAWQEAYDAAEEKAHYVSPDAPNISQTPPTPEELEKQKADQARYRAEEEERHRVEAAQRRLLPEILATPPAEIEARLAAAPLEECADEIVARALIRWMNGDAKRGPAIVEAMLQAHDPRGVLRKIAERDPIPLQFLLEWGILDPAGFKEWAPSLEREERRSLVVKAHAVLSAFAFPQDVRPIADWVNDYGEDGEIQTKNPVAFRWAEIDPGSALPWIWSHGGARAYGFAADEATSAGNRAANAYRAAVAAFDDYAVPIPDEILYMIMERWSSTDAAACARHGVRWCLRTRYYSQRRMIRLWTGFEDPDDGAVDDRHFGSLRIWAMRQPEQIRQWIRQEPLDEEVRTALLWLVDNAKGGFAPKGGRGRRMP